MIQGRLRLVWAFRWVRGAGGVVEDNHGLRWVLEKGVSVFWAEMCAGSLSGTLEVPVGRDVGVGGLLGGTGVVGSPEGCLGHWEALGLAWLLGGPGGCWGSREGHGGV